MQWPHLKKIAFRWLFAYLVLYCIQLPPDWLWNRLVPWTGELLGVNATYRLNGSGDTTFHYVQVLCFVLTALAAALVWSLADYKRSHDHRMYLGLRVLVRLSLGIALIGYGAAKVIPSQFPPLALHRLVQPFGDASPMGLLWSFMGASAPYTIFSGAAEMLAGMLLFFPRTTTLGALVSIGVMSQVVALNFCYDVPVKLLSLHLLALAIFLAAPDARRLLNLFVLNRTADPASAETVLRRPAFLRAAFVLKLLLLAGVTVSTLYQSHSRLQAMAPKSPLYGIWQVEEYALEGEARPSEVPDNVRWRRLIIGRSEQFAFLERVNGKRNGYDLILDPAAGKLFLDSEFAYSTPEPETLRLDGSHYGRALSVTMRRVDESEFRLINRGFHWISESPYNR
ncbi:MAG: hypothetical protein OXL36_01735 [Bryobacterales bacterium]|nr:hypothetical protein [Bryobacterales bacterium]MDE0295483.1 hypothetical protein [Bryobacterales bacterium]